MAGTAMAALAAGHRVACVTATAGEAGESADPRRWPPERLATIRAEELHAALGILGIEDHTILGLPDGGLPTVDDADGVALITEVVRRVRPDTILTFGPDGMTGHLDHVVVGRWAEAAVAATGARCRVLHATTTPDWAAEFAEVNAPIHESGPPITPEHELALDVHLDDELLDRKVGALRAQASQTSGLVEALGLDTYRAWVAREAWREA
ncbi:PIG-L family deacetylase [Actinomarinicola tropica]|uniref:PIG-L family deacetylase n=2 Tax=Actinomarinicola tropica TaxID=2789776 RepID=A0A5Q2RR71_9ACTN|nr:PIG-L family deacetylase [Actinomarinicola tropica]